MSETETEAEAEIQIETQTEVLARHCQHTLDFVLQASQLSCSRSIQFTSKHDALSKLLSSPKTIMSVAIIVNDGHHNDTIDDTINDGIALLICKSIIL